MKTIERLEAHLEQLIEGAFVNMFRHRLQTQDLVVRLGRVMHAGVIHDSANTASMVVPDRYTIAIHPKAHQHLVQRYPELPLLLSEYLVAVAVESNYQFGDAPIVKLLADHRLAPGSIDVTAAYSSANTASTAAMQPVKIPQYIRPSNAQLVIAERQVIPLQLDVVNIGRGHDNQVVLDDLHVSRHHCQLRLRDGVFMLFDVQSRAGTFVNDVRIKEHRLQSGDVMRLGRTKIIYLDDNAGRSGDTAPFDPPEFNL